MVLVAGGGRRVEPAGARGQAALGPRVASSMLEEYDMFRLCAFSIFGRLGVSLSCTTFYFTNYAIKMLCAKLYCVGLVTVTTRISCTVKRNPKHFLWL